MDQIRKRGRFCQIRYCRNGQLDDGLEAQMASSRFIYASEAPGDEGAEDRHARAVGVPPERPEDQETPRRLGSSLRCSS